MPTPTNGSSATTAHRLDKINLLFYSSGLAFLMMIPIWVYSDLRSLINHLSTGSIIAANVHVREVKHGVLYYFFMNGAVHFAQNIIAFAILATTSPVTYSIASLVKRIAVICIAIMWFNQPVHPVQGLGICLTFFGLWMYNQAKGDVERGEKQARRVEARRELLLPNTNSESRMMAGIETPEIVESYPLRPSHTREHPSINIALATSTYNQKYPGGSSIPTIMVDPYPSPPKSLDSPPPEFNNIEPNAASTTITSPTAGSGAHIWNRRPTAGDESPGFHRPLIVGEPIGAH